jgi:hypothetical protein
MAFPEPINDAPGLTDTEWQMLYDALAHGEPEHRAWLRGMVQGFASAIMARPVSIKEVRG